MMPMTTLGEVAGVEVRERGRGAGGRRSDRDGAPGDRAFPLSLWRAAGEGAARRCVRVSGCFGSAGLVQLDGVDGDAEGVRGAGLRVLAADLPVAVVDDEAVALGVLLVDEEALAA